MTKKIRPAVEKVDENNEVKHFKTIIISILKSNQARCIRDESLLKRQIRRCSNDLKKAYNDSMKFHYSVKIREANNVSKETWNIILQKQINKRVKS